MDTGNDPRFLVAEKALHDVEGILHAGRIKAAFPRDRALAPLHPALAALMTLRYSYAEPAAIVAMKDYAALQDSVTECERVLGGPGFEERVKEEPLAVARAAWAFGTVRSLGKRLALPGNGPETGIDVAAGRVVSTHAHAGADNLLVCRVGAGRPLTVVTNDKTVHAEDRIGVALLQPVDLRGIVSQGMFLGVPGKGVLRGVEAGPDGRPQVPDAALGETRSMVLAYVSKK